MTKHELHIIEQIFTHPLPGKVAHAALSKNLRRLDYTVPEEVRMAAVMILLFPDKTDHLNLVFTERTVTNDEDTHSGQMSFPGGKYDDSDENLKATALRETQEEIGVAQHMIEVMGEISPLYIPISNFLAHPYVGYLDHEPTFIREEREVAEIVSYPLKNLLEYTIPSSTDIKVRNYWFKDVPYFDIQGKVVWGATSMILNEFLEAIRNVY